MEKTETETQAPASTLSEADTMRLQLYLERHARLVAQLQALALETELRSRELEGARVDLANTKNELNARYSLGPADEVSAVNGSIKRMN